MSIYSIIISHIPPKYQLPRSKIDQGDFCDALLSKLCCFVEMKGEGDAVVSVLAVCGHVVQLGDSLDDG